VTGSSGIVVPENKTCAFCEYLDGQRPFTIVKRTRQSAILVTREQRGVSHVLVVPLRHRETILDLEPDEASDVMRNVIDAARAISATERTAGIAIWQNNGIPADQTIAHVHFHVAGTLPSGGTERGEVDELTVDATDLIGDRLRAALGA
jgi:histidine triad (HIT) family protein